MEKVVDPIRDYPKYLPWRDRLRVRLAAWLGVTATQDVTNSMQRNFTERCDQLMRLVMERESEIRELQGRIEDLEAAYPDYNKAKEQAEENKSKEIVPGFRPFTQRKRAWEAQHRKPAEKK